MRKFFTHSHFLAIAFAALVLILVWFKDGLILGTAESALPFYDSAYHYNFTKYAWVDAWLGNSTGITTSTAPAYLVWTKLEELGVPKFIIEAGTIWALFTAAGIFIYKLIKLLFPEIKSRYLLMGVLFYWFNPLSAANVWNRFLYNHMFLWALLPVSIYFYLKGLIKKDLRYSIFSSLSTLVFSYALSSLTFVLVLFSLYLFIFIAFGLLKRDTRFNLVFFTSTVLSFVGLNSWWISQIIAGGSRASYQAVITKFFTSLGNLESLTDISERLGQFSYNFRFLHKFLIEQKASWISIFNNPLTQILQFFLTGIILWVIYKLRHKFEVILFGSIFILSLFLLKGNADPLGEIFEFFFLKIPYLQVFRNPFEKLSFVTALAASPLLALGLNEIEKYIKKDKRPLFYIGGFVYLLLVLGFPFWTGGVLVGPKGYSKKESLSYKVEVPSYYEKAASWFKDNAHGERAVVLPLGEEGITYSWDYPYQGVEISNILLDMASLSLNTTIPFYSDIISELSKNQLSKSMFNFYPFLNAKYLVFRPDIDFQARKMANPKVIEDKIGGWINEGLIERKAEFGQLKIYEIRTDYLLPKFSVSSEFILSNSKDINWLVQFASDFPGRKPIIVPVEIGEKEDFSGSQRVFVPERVFTPFITDSLGLRKISEEDAVARLFYVSHLPGKWYYPLIRVKEVIETPPKSNYPAWISFETELLGKRAVEIYRLRKGGYPSELVAKMEKQYLKRLEENRGNLIKAFEQHLANSDLIRDSLLYQLTLFVSSGSPLKDDLSRLLAEARLKPTYDLPESDGDYLVYQFDIGQEGTFTLFLDKIPQALFVDGEKYGLGAEESSQVKLNRGFHEFALLFTEGQLSQTLAEEETLRNTEKERSAWKISIPDTPARFFVGFDYRFEKGKRFDLVFVQDIDHMESPVFGARITKEELFHDWKHWEGPFTSSNGATEGQLSSRPIIEEKCVWGIPYIKRCNEIEDKFDVEIRNFKISQVDYPTFGLLQRGKPEENIVSSETTVVYEKIEPTEYKVALNKKSSSREILVFSELYNPGWELEREGGGILENKHILVNVYANGWVFDTPGSYHLFVRFVPQTALRRGTALSLIILAVSLGLVGLLSWRRKS